MRKIGRNCIVGAGSVVTEGKEFPDNSLIVGSAGQGDAHAGRREPPPSCAQSAEHYVANARRFAKGLKKIG